MLPILIQECPINTIIKKIHFIRHGHGKHNEVGETDKSQYLREDLIDAELTDLGIKQCNDLYNINQILLSTAELLVVSPMRRTLQTAALSFPNLVNQIPWIALEHIREQTGLHPCDKRFPISHHQNNHSHVDFNEIQHDEDPLYDLYERREPDNDLDERAKQFLIWLESRKETEIIVVTHSAFLRGLFQRVLFPDKKFHSFKNCEVRTYLFHYPIKAQEQGEEQKEEIENDQEKQNS